MYYVDHHQFLQVPRKHPRFPIHVSPNRPHSCGAVHLSSQLPDARKNSRSPPNPGFRTRKQKRSTRQTLHLGPLGPGNKPFSLCTPEQPKPRASTEVLLPRPQDFCCTNSRQFPARNLDFSAVIRCLTAKEHWKLPRSIGLPQAAALACPPARVAIRPLTSNSTNNIYPGREEMQQHVHVTNRAT